MLLLIMVALLGVVSTVFAAAILPVRQAPPDPMCPKSCLDIATLPACTPITRYSGHYTWTKTVTEAPSTVTIAVVDSASIGQQFSSWAGIDSIEASQMSELNPVGVTPPAPVYTHTASASLYEATEAPNESYYVPKPQDDTPESAPVATTTVFISPLPAPPKVQGEINSTISTTNIRTATVTGYGIWNTSVGDVGTSATGGLTGASSGGFGVLATTATAYLATITASSTVLVTASSTINGSFGGYGLPPASKHAQSARLVPPQTCTWVTAERLGGWCNNWDGSTIVSYATYDTTVYPGATSTPMPTGTNLSQPAQPVECGEVGPFVIGFDNLPMFSTTDNSTTAHPPVFNPFEHFWWGDCWTYAPPPNEKYLPQEGVHLAKCIPNNNNTVIGSPNAGLLPANGFGAGPRESINAYWFDAHSTFVACDDNPFDLNETCQFSVTAWKWDGTTEIVLSTDVYTLPSCRSGVNCRLHQIPFPLTYAGLTSLNFSATIDDKPRSFYMDTIRLSWFNNSCEAGLMRISSRKVRLV